MKNKMIENVKDYIKDIVEDNYLTQDEIVYIVRAYTFIDKNNYIKSIITKIPFKYIKLTSSFNIKEISYPLNHVLGPIDSNKTISKMTEEESNNYYLIYSKDILMEVL